MFRISINRGTGRGYIRVSRNSLRWSSRCLSKPNFIRLKNLHKVLKMMTKSKCKSSNRSGQIPFPHRHIIINAHNLHIPKSRLHSLCPSISPRPIHPLPNCLLTSYTPGTGTSRPNPSQKLFMSHNLLAPTKTKDNWQKNNIIKTYFNRLNSPKLWTTLKIIIRFRRRKRNNSNSNMLKIG